MTTTQTHPAEIVLTTRSGSEYHIDGTTVWLAHDDQPDERFILIGLDEHRLRYTDGEKLYISSAVVNRQAA